MATHRERGGAPVGKNAPEDTPRRDHFRTGVIVAFVLACAIPAGGQFRPDYLGHDRLRPYEAGRFPYDSRFASGIDLEKRLREEGDSRCYVLQPDHLPLMKSVTTLFGTFEGEYRRLHK